MALYTKTNDFNLIGHTDGTAVTVANSDDNGQDGLGYVSSAPSPVYSTTTTKVGDTAIRLSSSTSVGTYDGVGFIHSTVGSAVTTQSTSAWVYLDPSTGSGGRFNVVHEDTSSWHARCEFLEGDDWVISLQGDGNGGATQDGTVGIPEQTWTRVDVFSDTAPGSQVLKARIVSLAGQVLDEVIHSGPVMNPGSDLETSTWETWNDSTAITTRATIDDLWMQWDGTDYRALPTPVVEPLYTRTNDFNLIGQADGAWVTTGTSDDNGQDGFWVVSGQPFWDTTTTKVGDTAVRLEVDANLGVNDIVEFANQSVQNDDDIIASNTWLYWHSGGPASGQLSVTFRTDLSTVFAEVVIDQVARVLTLIPTTGPSTSGAYAIPDDTWVRVQTFIDDSTAETVFKARLLSEGGQVLDEVIVANPSIGWATYAPERIRWTLTSTETTPFLQVTIDDLMIGWSGDLTDYWDSGTLTISETTSLDATADIGTPTLEVWQHVILPKTWKNGVDRLSAFNLNAEVRDRFKAWQGQEWRDWTPEWRFLKMAAEDIPLNVETGNIGTGTLTGRFLELGQLRMFRIRWDIGTGMTYDTSDDPGFWAFTLPTGGAMIPGSLSGEGQLDPGPTWIQPGAIERFQLSEAQLYTQGIKTNGVVPIFWISAQPYPLQWNTGTVGSKARVNGAVLELGGTYLVEPDPEETS